MPSAFVTGASGFIGGALTRRLVSEGWSVRALARSASSEATVRERGAEPVRGDLDDVTAMRAGAEGVDVVFHAAAHLGEFGRAADFEHGNVQGTKNALAAAGDATFVHVGTEAALYDGKHPLLAVDERAPLALNSPVLYSRTKAEAEAEVIAAGGISVRPRLVWGPGDMTVLPGFVQAVEDGRFAWIGGSRQLTSTAHIDNVVEGLMLAAAKGRPGNAYFITDGTPVVFRDFATRWLATAGVTAPDKNVPKPLALALANGGERLFTLLRRSDPPPVTRLAVFLLARECTLDITKARTELGYEPLVTVDEGLAALAAGTP